MLRTHCFTNARCYMRALGAIVLLAIALDAVAQQSPTRPGRRRAPELTERDPERLPLRGTAETPETGRPTPTGGPQVPGQPQGGTEVSVTEGTTPTVTSRIVGPQTNFEPLLQRPLEYGDVPDVDESATMSLKGPMSAKDFLDALALTTGWNIATTQAVGQLMLDFWTNEISPKQALAILRFNDVYYEFDAETSFLFVSTKQEHLERRFGDIVTAEFLIHHTDLQNAETVLTSLLSARGRLIADPVSSKLIIYDTEDNLASMRRALSEIDAPQDTRAYELVHVDAEALATTVEALLTEAGRLSVDPRSNTLVVQDRPERLERIAEVVALLDEELETRSWILDYADPIELANNIALLVPEAMGSIVVNEPIHQITVTATPYRLAEIDKRIAVWDEKRRQVQIEAYLATVSRNIIRNLGINWAYAASINGDPLTMAVGSLTDLPGSGDDDDDDDGSSSPGAGSRVAFNGNSLDAIVRILNSSNDATILAHPRITVQDGEEAAFENTTSVPFASSTTVFSTNSDFNNSNTQIDFIDVGTVLRVIPRISSEDSILLNLEAEDSTFVSVEIFANGEINTLPQKTQNRAETQVLVRDTETIVLGGLRTSNLTDTVDRIPILGEIPIIGRAFRTTGKDHQDRELLIFLTPTIVGEDTQPETVKLAEIEDGISQQIWIDNKTTLQRLTRKVNDGKGEFTVSIGQSGGLLAEGQPITMDGLRTVTGELDSPTNKTMVIREHPSAPRDVAAEVTDIAMERGLKIEFDDRRFPFVPRLPNTQGGPLEPTTAGPAPEPESGS